MATVHPQVISTDMFFWDRETGEFHQEASSLRWTPGCVPRVFKLQSQRTAKVITMEMQHIERMEQRGEEIPDVAAYHYAPDFESGLADKFSLVVFND